MLTQILLLLLGGLVFLFSFWRRLKEDYFDNQIFTTGVYIFLFVLIGNVVSSYLAPLYWFWFSLVGMIIGIGLGSLRFKMRFFENLEAGVAASFIPIILILLYDGIRYKHAASFFAIAAVVALIGFYYFLSLHYKKITWYKSGRIGFSGIAILGIFLIFRALLAVWFPNMVSLSPYDWLISGSAAFLSFLTLIHLSYKV